MCCINPDFGAIAVNIQDDKQLESDYRRIMGNVKDHAPDADIEGVLNEKMAPKGYGGHHRHENAIPVLDL